MNCNTCANKETRNSMGECLSYRECLGNWGLSYCFQGRSCYVTSYDRSELLGMARARLDDLARIDAAAEITYRAVALTNV